MNTHVRKTHNRNVTNVKNVTTRPSRSVMHASQNGCSAPQMHDAPIGHVARFAVACGHLARLAVLVAALAGAPAAAASAAQLHAPVAAASSMAPSARSGVPDGRSLVSTAQSYLGVPYVWGGNDAHGFDCSGFVGAVYARHGYRLPRVSRQQGRIGTPMHTLPLQPGDLLFFAEIPGSTRITHVAMSIGGSRFIHAALGKGEVSYDSLDENYYARRWLGARRVLDLPPGNYATREGLAPDAAQLPAHEPIAANVRAGEAAQEMVEEHPSEGPIHPLARPSGRAGGFEPGADPFSAALLLPQETGAGARFGFARLPLHDALFLQPEARYFGHASSLQLDVAAPFLWPVSGPGRHLAGHGVRWRSARDWGRLVRAASYGRRDTRLYVGLERAMAITLGDGGLMRHYVPNGASMAQEDLLVTCSDLTATVVAQGSGLELVWTLDDLLAPQVTGLSLRTVPTQQAGTYAARHLGVIMGWAMDHEAPTRELSVPQEPLRHRAVHLGEAGLTYLLHDGVLVARTYLTAAGRLAATHPSKAAFGTTIGLFTALAGEEVLGAPGHRLTLRLEARFGGPGWRANYIPFSYAHSRIDAPYRNAGNSTVTGAIPQLTLLLSQNEQPRHFSGLIELTYAFGNRMGLGVSYEDGGALGAEAPGPVPVDRNLTVYAMARNVPLGRGGRTLRARLLWHWSAMDKLWPPVHARAAHSFGLLLVRADVLSWLDAGLSVRKPLGGTDADRTVVGTADVAAHFAF